MIRVLNFFAFAVTALACLALYHVSEQTRVTRDELSTVNHDISSEQTRISVLQAEWSKVAAPARIQALAQTRLGLADKPVVELSSLTLLPRRGETLEPGDAQVRNASATAPAIDTSNIHLAALHTGN